MSELDPADPRLFELERRLDRIERVLGLPPRTPQPAATPTIPAATTPPLAPQAVGSPPVVVPPRTQPSSQFRAATYVDAASRERPPKRRDASAFDIERWVGGRWYAVLGAVIIVIGIGLFAKLAVARGWFAMPVIARCSIGAGFGFVLLGVAAWVRRRFNAWAAFGLFAAGLGSIYACTYAAYRLWEPLTASPALAFVLLALVAALGIGIAVYSRLAAVGVVAQVCGYLTPFLFTDAAPSPLVLPSYLLALLVIALVLSAWRGGPFVVMRGVAWWATVLLGAVFVLGNAGDHPLIAILFISLVWAAIHAELVSSARIRGLGTHIDHAGGGSVRLATPLVSSLSTTAWTVILGVIIFRAWHTIPDWLVPAAMTGASGVLGMTLAGHLRVLRDIPETDAERLGAGLLVQAGGCLFAAIALALSGELEVLAWMGLGVAAAACGRWLHTRAFSVYGLISLAVATARLLVWDSWVGATAVPDAAVYGILISHWMGLTAVAGVLWLALAALVRRDEKSAWSTRAGLAAWAGIALLAACFLHEGAALTSLCLVWCVLALVVAGLAEVLQGLTLRWAALALWIVAAITWAIAYPFDTWNNRAWSLAVHPGAVMVLILAASGLAMGWWLARRESRSAAFAGAAIVVVLLVFAGSTLEVGRVVGVLAGDVRSPRAAVSIWWGLFACALIAGGFRRRTPGVRWTGLALLGVAGIKAVLFDLAGVSDIARIISFVGLGLLMLGVALVYSKVSATLEEPKVVPSPLPSKPDSGFDAA